MLIRKKSPKSIQVVPIADDPSEQFLDIEKIYKKESTDEMMYERKSNDIRVKPSNAVYPLMDENKADEPGVFVRSNSSNKTDPYDLHRKESKRDFLRLESARDIAPDSDEDTVNEDPRRPNVSPLKRDESTVPRDEGSHKNVVALSPVTCPVGSAGNNRRTIDGRPPREDRPSPNQRGQSVRDFVRIESARDMSDSENEGKTGQEFLVHQVYPSNELN
jgi:hypothetical protein